MNRRALLAGVAACGVAACDIVDGHPSDARIIREFRDRRARYDSLLQMVLEETRVTRVSYDFIWVDGAGSPTEAERAALLPDPRWDQYKQLFEALELESGVLRGEGGGVGFFRSSSGFIFGGSSKAIWWSREELPRVLAPGDRRSLEDSCSKEECFVARSLAPEWYLTYDHH